MLLFASSTYECTFSDDRIDPALLDRQQAIIVQYIMRSSAALSYLLDMKCLKLCVFASLRALTIRLYRRV
jgi:hypothetical protein